MIKNETLSLDTSTWKYFTIGKEKGGLFKLERCKNKASGDLLDGDDCFYLGAKKSANCVMRRVVREDDLVTKGNCIIFIGNGQGSVGYSNYMNEDFIGTADLTVGYNEHLNPFVGLFIVTVLDLERPKFSFGRKWSARIAETKIKLPSTPNGTPDWEYMENYIKSLSYGEMSVDLLGTKNSTDNALSIEIVNWSYFPISGKNGIFKIEPCKCSNAGELLEDGNDIDYIGAKKNDNGVMRRVQSNEELTTKGNCIIFICDGQGSVGYTNYIENDFIGSTTLSVGRNSRLNRYNALFLVAVLDRERYRYSFGRKYKTNLSKARVLLPAKDNEPDWDYMEKYIKSLPYGDRI